MALAIYSAKKVNPRIEDGVFKVDVEIYENDRLVKTERFETTQEQDADWPSEGVKAIIDRLKTVPTLVGKVTAGDVVLPDAPIRDQAEIDWQNDFSVLKSAQTMISISGAFVDNPAYVALVDRVVKNFKPEYIGLV